jgi:hypothetical protein
MQRAKLLAVCAGALLILAATAIPASAWFNARTNGATQGLFHSGGAQVFTLPSGGELTCSKAVGAWHIESSGKVLEQNKGPGQQLTKQGPHLGLTVSKWEGCSATGEIPVVVEPCLLQVEQPVKTVNKGTGSVGTACNVKIIALQCEFAILNAHNEFLKEAAFAASGLNVEVKANLGEVTTSVTKSQESHCSEGGISNNDENNLKAIIIAEGVELI